MVTKKANLKVKKSMKKKSAPTKRAAKSHIKTPKKAVTTRVVRPPQRKIVDDNKKIQLVRPKGSSLLMDSPSEAAKEDRHIKLKQSVSAPKIDSAPVIKLDWDKLPQSSPPQYRFYISMARKECQTAASWPFPFAKFISALPQRICGFGFLMLLMSLEHDVDYLTSALKISREEAEQQLKRAASELLDLCESLCPEMYRKVRTQLGGVGVSIDTLLERYLVQKVDKNFQLTAGALVLKALAQ